MCIRDRYKFGEYVTENEIRMAKFLSDMPQEKLESMARTYTEGYRRGFLAANIDPVSYTHLDVYKRQEKEWSGEEP